MAAQRLRPRSLKGGPPPPHADQAFYACACASAPRRALSSRAWTSRATAAPALVGCLRGPTACVSVLAVLVGLAGIPCSGLQDLTDGAEAGQGGRQSGRAAEKTGFTPRLHSWPGPPPGLGSLAGKGGPTLSN